MRIAALLDPYFDKGTPPMVRALEAEDWAEELRVFPKWAVEAAARWWKSGDNPDRRKRPLEGDIAARCRKEMDAIRAAQVVLAAPMVTVQDQVASSPAPDDVARRKAVADEILRGFAGNRMT